MTALTKLSVEAWQASVPVPLREKRRWAGWLGTKRPRVLSTGRNAKTDNPATWGTFDEACAWYAKYERRPDAGVGFVTGDDVGALDFDDAREPATGEALEWAAADVRAASTVSYTEVSPSGKGFRALLCGGDGMVEFKPGKAPSFKPHQFVTVTGWRISETSDLAPAPERLQHHFARGAAPKPAPARREGEPDTARVKSALDAIDPDTGHDEWLRIGMALHAGFQGDAEGFLLWDEWSAAGGKYQKGEPAQRWGSFKSEKGVTLGTLFHIAKAHGWQPGPTPEEDFGGSAEGGGIAGFAVLDDINQEFFIIEEGGRHFVACEFDDPAWGRRALKRFKLAEFKTRYLGKTVRSHDGKEIPLATSWLAWKHRREYLGGVVFDPSGRERPGVFNLWRGWPIEPRPGDWSIVREHFREVICSGNEAHFAYVMGWLRRLVQQPDRPGEVVLALRSKEEGAGKGLACTAVRRMFGQHALAVERTRSLTGQFNAHLRDLVVLVANEAVFAGDHSSGAVLRSLICDPTMQIEQKGVDPFEVRNFLHILMTTNEDWAVPVSLKDRRFAIFDVSPRRVGDRAYFEKLGNAVDDDAVIGAMLHDLLAEPLGAFQVRDIPVTAARVEQMVHSLQGAEAWLRDVLARGELGSGADWQEWVSTATLISSHEEWARSARFRHLVPGVVLGKFLRRFFRACRPRDQGESGLRRPGFQLGGLSEARARFCEVLGFPADLFGADDEVDP